MQLQTAQRHRAKIKMALQGPSGSGKTYSALLVAYGLSGNWSTISVIDTENHSADLYAHLGPYQVLSLSAPFTPEKYCEAIQVCEQAGAEVVIIDSTSHEWECLLDYHSSLQGNSFTNWSKVTPRHQDFISRILQSSCHIICTVRTKQDYVLTEKNGKMVPEKVGLKSIQRDGLDFEMTLVFDLDIKNHAVASKDRTGLFFGKPEQKLTVQAGQQIRDWCNSGQEVGPDEVSRMILQCTSIPELYSLYKKYPAFQQSLKPEFESQKRRLLITQQAVNNIPNLKPSTNGTLS